MTPGGPTDPDGSPAAGPVAAVTAPASPAGPPADPELRRPDSLSALFWAFSWLALQGFGGVLAIAQQELVDKHRWMSREEFVETLAVAQVLPGPNIVNLSLMFGDRYFGLRGALVAVAGMLVIPALIVLALAVLATTWLDTPQVAGALRGMGAVSAGLVLATGLKLLPSLKRNVLGLWLGVALGAAVFAGTVWLKLPLIWIVLSVGGLGMALALQALKRAQAAARGAA